MKFWKKQLKKTNRGLVLALILILGVAIFTIVDNINFKKEKPEIEQVITDYIDEMETFAVTPQEFLGKEEISDEEFKPYQEKWNEYVNKYWVYKKRNPDSIYWYTLMSDIKDMYSSLKYRNENEQVISCSYDARNIKITKAGPNCATATLTLKMIAEYKDYASILTPMYTEIFGWMTDEGEENKVFKTRAEGEYTLTLERTSDGWKIYKCDGYVTSMQDITNEG